MEKIRYNHLNSYLKGLFGERTLKVCVDGGFTCPNRDGSKGTCGCVFCGKLGAGDLIKFKGGQILDSIENQVKGFLNSYRGERANKFIVYFQSFSNTYDTIANLKLKYDKALGCSDKIVGLEVATRPDCITKEIVELLASYKDRYYVCVELGLQTGNDDIGKLINRGYTTDDFIKAVGLLNQFGIPVVAHIMVGLPSETDEDINSTINIINDVQCAGVKIHSTYVMKDTKLEQMYRLGEYVPITQDYYVEQVVSIIGRLNKDIVIHRINADPPKSELVAPEWVARKKVVLNAINKQLAVKDVIQGCLTDK